MQDGGGASAGKIVIAGTWAVVDVTMMSLNLSLSQTNKQETCTVDFSRGQNDYIPPDVADQTSDNLNTTTGSLGLHAIRPWPPHIALTINLVLLESTMYRRSSAIKLLALRILCK
jgi:hypothetical protein